MLSSGQQNNIPGIQRLSNYDQVFLVSKILDKIKRL